MLPALLAEHGIAGPAVGRVAATGRFGDVTLEQVAIERPGQSFAFVMDTGLCDNVYALADGVDLLVIESTFLTQDADLAAVVGHLTAGTGRRGGPRVPGTHAGADPFLAALPDPSGFLDEARKEFDGEIVLAEDLIRVPVPPRLLPDA